MAELEKIKQARQTSMNLSKTTVQSKDTLKPRNVSVVTNNNLDEQIAVSRYEFIKSNNPFIFHHIVLSLKLLQEKNCRGVS